MYSFCQQMGNSESLKMRGKSAILMIPVGRWRGRKKRERRGGGGGGGGGEEDERDINGRKTRRRRREGREEGRGGR